MGARGEPRDDLAILVRGAQAIQAPAVAASAVVLSKVAMRVISGKPLVCSCHALEGSVERQDRSRI